MTNIAYIALGSNRGDKVSFLKKAVQKIVDDSNCALELASSIYETKPYGVKEQDNFLNAVIKISTSFNLTQLFIFLKNIEDELGRKSNTKWGPREIDLDLLFFNNIVYSDEKIIIPHKEIELRDFVLTPLCEIAPDLFHPVLNQKISDICIDEKNKTIIAKIQDKIL
ncbi:MAG TPA: 2-amino-4-hydroxy-6-hydroxymethyldihydropteridine diphosphokinase [Ignavibacteriaceae bacterium]|nr:2-amino-4-hydroxy-6-hydroxymethyldihydropteridine diphosphokinase [Ignavibacteriaceae bacterium]